MKRKDSQTAAIRTTLLTGLAAVVPAAITVYIIYITISFLESFCKQVVLTVVDEYRYIPGAGTVVFLLLLFLVGTLLRNSFFKRLFTEIEEKIRKVPLAKSIYGSVKDMVGIFSSSPELNQPVLIQSVSPAGAIMGFLTNPNPAAELKSVGPEFACVYIPMSYQVGGFTVIVPRDSLEYLEVDKEDYLRFILTAGVRESGKNGASAASTES